MNSNDDVVGRLVEVLEKDTHIRAEQLANLNKQLEERNLLLEQQISGKTSAARWNAFLAVILAIGVGVWVYLFMLQVKTSVEDMSSSIVTIQSYLKGAGGNKSGDIQAGYMMNIARNTESMSSDMGATREAMQSASADITSMRQSMEEMRMNIASMNAVMGNLGGDMRHVSNNIAGMSRSVSHMNQSVQRLSSDSEYMPGPFRGVMPWR